LKARWHVEDTYKVAALVPNVLIGRRKCRNPAVSNVEFRAAPDVTIAGEIPDEDVIENKTSRVVTETWECMRKTFIENNLAR
jgi:hypothetical protein